MVIPLSASFATNDNLVSKQAVILYGSPHLIGSTFRLLHQFKQDLATVTREDYVFVQFDLFDQKITPCNDCKSCQYGLCHLNHTDCLSAVIEAIQLADVVIVATPIYFAGFPAPFKVLVDRMQQFYVGGFKGRSYTFPTRKKGFLLTTAGSGQPDTKQAMRHAAKMLFDCLNADFSGAMFHENTDLVGEEGSSRISPLPVPDCTDMIRSAL